jgi:hypothetical protein
VRRGKEKKGLAFVSLSPVRLLLGVELPLLSSSYPTIPVFSSFSFLPLL